MIESISIKNLGPIKDIHIEHIKPFTVLIGESGGGKSTLMKAIALFRWIYKMQNIRSYLKHSNISKSPFRYRVDTYLRNCGFDDYNLNETEIIYTVSHPSGNRYVIKYSDKKLLGINTGDLIDIADINFNKVSFISETRNLISLLSNSRSMPSVDSLGFYFMELYNDFDRASEVVKELELKFLDVKFSVKKTSTGKKFAVQSIDDDQYQVNLKNSSSGQQNAFPLSLIANYFASHFQFEDAFNRSVLGYLSNTDSLRSFKPVLNLSEMNKTVFIHVEEPELSLFPDAQCKLISDLVANCFMRNSNRIEMILSTHSPYVINHLNLLIKAFDKDKKVDGAQLNYSDIVVYQVSAGRLENLMVLNENLVNTNPLSDTINDIYNKYNDL